MVKKVPPSNELHIVNPPKKFTEAYPISTFTYAIVPHNGPQKSLVAEFINYAITVGKKYGPALDFAPMPKVVVTAAKAAVASL
jgi:phosphate transport system substrate-binding protein